MDLHELINIKFPTINWLSGECVIEAVDGQSVITAWTRSEPWPSQDDLNQWASDSDTIAAVTKKRNDEINLPILAQLDSIDIKSIRALRTNDTARLTTLEAQAATLRNQLLK